MKFSIIVPFNRGTEYLRDCFSSLSEQISYKYLDGEAAPGVETIGTPLGERKPFLTEKYADFEVILVLDHPKEKVNDIIDEFAESFSIKVVTLDKETGVSAARNKGLEAAQGEYVYFLDCDDFLYIGALFRLAEAAEDAEQPDIIYGKKIWSWYSRTGFQASNISKNEEKRKELEALAIAAIEKQRKAAARRNFFRRKDDDPIEEGDNSSAESGTNESGDNSGAGETSEAFKELSAMGEGLKLVEDIGDDEDLDEVSFAMASLSAERAEQRRKEIEAKRIEAQEKDDELKRTLSESEYIEFKRRQAARRLVSTRKGIGNVSALHVAIKRSVIVENNITFPEDIRYYADCSFICKALYHSTTFRKCYLSRYVKRKHNDPVNFPSIAQENAPERFDELIKAFDNTMEGLPSDSIVRTIVERKFISYYTGFFVTQIRRNRNDVWRVERFEKVRKLMEKVSDETVKQSSLFQKRLIKALRKNDVDKVYRIISGKLFFRKAWKCITSFPTRRKAFYEHRYLKKPVVENWILFECFFGKSYGDNPKGIYEYIAKNYGDNYRFIWSMEKPGKSKIPYGHKTVRRGSLRYAYYVARCKYFVFNTKQPKWMKKRPEQVFLETWHGTPLKRLAFDMEDNFSAAPGYKKEIYGMTRRWDYLVSANAFSSEKFRSCFMYDGKMLEYGYPRNDILHRPDRDELAVSIKKKLGIPLNKKTILYAPTWRDDEFYAAGQYKFTLKLELPKLRAALGDEYVILLRTHYYIADKLDVTGMEGFAYNLSKYDDIADIYLISDICITDYSSVFFDYANLKRPMLFYTYDIDKYRDMLRGFYFDMESTVPGPLLYTTEEVVDAIKDIDAITGKFADRYEVFYERFCGWEDGHASENIVKQVILGQPAAKK